MEHLTKYGETKISTKQGLGQKHKKMEGDNNNNVAIPPQEEPIAPKNNNAIEKEGAELLVPDSSKCPVCMEDPFCGFCPFACDHVICLKCVDPSVMPRRLECCPLCRNDAWVFPLEVKAVGSDREREVIAEIAKIARVGNEMQETIRHLSESLDHREQARYEEEARKRLDEMMLASKPMIDRANAMSAKIVKNSTRRFAVQAGTKLLGLWVLFLLAICSQSLVLSLILLVMTFSAYVVATEYVNWAEHTHGKLLSHAQEFGGEVNKFDKKHRPRRREPFEHLHFYMDREDRPVGDRRNAPIGAVRRRDVGEHIAVAAGVQTEMVDGRNMTVVPGDRVEWNILDDMRANQVVQEN
jgi:hypothetical protein